MKKWAEVGRMCAEASSAKQPPGRTGGKGLVMKKHICKWWERGECDRGKWCVWAHGEKEIGEWVEDKKAQGMKVTLCQNWQRNQRCSFGKLCQFAHGEEDQLAPAPRKKQDTEPPIFHRAIGQMV